MFFLRDPEYARRMGGAFMAESETKRQRQQQLKSEIERAGLPTFQYSTPEQMAAQFKQEFLTRLDR